jgi:5'-AMP-activated protein kinase catalytic alpha subunit
MPLSRAGLNPNSDREYSDRKLQSEFEKLEDREYLEFYDEVRTLKPATLGNLKAVQNLETGKQYAGKTISPEILPEDVAREVNLQELVESEHIVKIEKKFRTQGGAYIIMSELLPDGKLSDHLRSGGFKDSHDMKHVFQQIVEGIQHCHELGVAHLDLKPDNIWCDDQTVKIGDFGYAMLAQEKAMVPTAKGSPAYLAPELLRQWADVSQASSMWANIGSSGHTPLDLKAVDVWALGVILYEMLTDSWPWKCKLLFPSEVMNCLDRIEENLRPLPAGFSREATDLVRHMLEPDPSKRFTVEQVANHPYFSQPAPA